MHDRVADYAWSATPLGPMESWPQSLKVAVGICLKSNFPMFVWWGPELINIYNDAYAPLLGLRHPEALGMGAKEIWADIWQTIDSDVRGVMERGEATTRERVRFIMLRHGYPEEAFYTYSYSPIPDESGGVGGMFQVCVEETGRVLAERERDRSSHQRQLALDAAQLGWWHYNPLTGESNFDEQYAQMFQVSGSSRANADLLKRLHPDDLPGVWQKVERALDPNRAEPYSTHYRIVLDDGSLRWIEAHGAASFEGESANRKAVSFVGTVADVTERVVTTDRLRAREQEFRELANAMPQIVWAAGPDGVLDYYNRRWYEFIGVPDNVGLAAVAWSSYVHPDDLAHVAIVWADSLSRGVTYQSEFRVRDAQGRYVWMLVRAEPTRDSTGNIVRWFGTCTDIEKRRQSEAESQFLLKLDTTVRALTDSAEITAMHARMLGEHLKVNRCAYADVEEDQDTFNLTGDHVDGVPSVVGRYRFGDFGPQVLGLMRADQPFVVSDIDQHQPQTDVTAYRAMNIRAVICVPLHKAGRFTAAMAVHQTSPRQWTHDEVSLVRTVAARCWESIERARVQRELRQSEARFRTIADSAPVLIWLAERPRERTWVNQPWLNFTGCTMEQVIGTGWADSLHPDDRERCLTLFFNAFESRTPYQMDYRLRRHDGEYRWMISHGMPMVDSDGVFKGFVGSAIDITERKLAEKLREGLLEVEQAARSDADRASRMKDEFLATLSHELRTPLNAILGWSQIIRLEENLPADVINGVTVIERNARAQAQIIEDLLDMSRIISGKLRLDVQRVDLAAITQAAVDTARPTADAKGVRLQAIIDPLHGAAVSGDANRLQQVLWNLLSNAIKFTPKGGRVQVLLERVNSHLEMRVSDSGEGIDAEFLPHVFDRFRQADASTTRRHGGLGLGLSIVKQLVELHGGDVAVRSAGLKQGSTFIVTLPLTVIQHEPEVQRRHPSVSDLETRPTIQHDLAGLMVLVVDDEADARMLVKRLLEERGAKIVAAESAGEALEFLRQRPFDLLISDIGMPGEDGYALIRQVRALASPARDVPAIALTAYARAEDRVRAVSAGFIMHVAKPFEAVELITMAAGAVGRIGRDDLRVEH